MRVELQFRAARPRLSKTDGHTDAAPLTPAVLLSLAAALTMRTDATQKDRVVHARWWVPWILAGAILLFVCLTGGIILSWAISSRWSGSKSIATNPSKAKP